MQLFFAFFFYDLGNGVYITFVGAGKENLIKRRWEKKVFLPEKNSLSASVSLQVCVYLDVEQTRIQLFIGSAAFVEL